MNANLLDVMEQKKLHAHVLTDEDRKLIGTFECLDPRNTHYVMNGEGAVVHYGTPATVERFAYAHKTLAAGGKEGVK